MGIIKNSFSQNIVDPFLPLPHNCLSRYNTFLDYIHCDKYTQNKKIRTKFIMNSNPRGQIFGGLSKFGSGVIRGTGGLVSGVVGGTAAVGSGVIDSTKIVNDTVIGGSKSVGQWFLTFCYRLPCPF